MNEAKTYLLEMQPDKKPSASLSKKAKIKANYPAKLFNLPAGVKPVVLFSGGRTSGFMLKRLLEIYPNFREDFLVCFGNTGKEMPETLDFVHEVETRWKVEVVWLEYARVLASQIPAGIFPTDRRNQNLATATQSGETAHWFKVVNYETASRDGKPFDEMLEWASVLPNQGARMCSVQLKIRTVMRYLFSLGLKEYAPIIGIRKDEENRVLEILASADNFEHCQFPLVDFGVTEAEVLNFWNGNYFDLQIEGYLGNCDLCFLKATHKRVRIAKERPVLLGWWKHWETVKALTCDGDGKFFRKGQPYSKIEQMANESGLLELPANDVDIPCSCAERGFKKDDDENSQL